MTKRATSIAVLVASASLVGAGWFAAASLAGGAEVGAAAAPDPGSLLFMDATGEDPIAADINRVWVSNSAADEITVQIEITNAPTLDPDLSVDVQLDIDRANTTGRPSDGADFELAVSGATFPAPDFVRLLQWSGGAWQPVASTIHATYNTTAPFGPVITVPRAEIANTTGFDVVAVTELVDGHDTASDRAPNSGAWDYPLTFPATTSSTTTTDPDQHGWVDEHDDDGAHHTTTTPSTTTTTTPTTTTPTTTVPPTTTTITTPASTTTTTVVSTTSATTTVVCEHVGDHHGHRDDDGAADRVTTRPPRPRS